MRTQVTRAAFSSPPSIPSGSNKALTRTRPLIVASGNAFALSPPDADPNGDWLQERSYFALGLDQSAAFELGAKFHQDAVVWAGPDAIPRLLLLR
jgi:hypothetical protein